jgi:predicted nucleic acid-binding protein
LELGATIEIPVVVLAETVRGGPRDAPLNRILKAIGSVPVAQEAHGRTAGRLLGSARSSSTVDALVVAQAVEAGGAQILTGDREDLERLAEAHPEVWIQPL